MSCICTLKEKRYKNRVQYFGGKGLIAGPIINLLESLRDGRDFLEPFCGGLWITAGMSGVREASDIHESLITLYQSMQKGWEPPDTLSEAEYGALKAKKDSTNPLTAFAGFGCSFSGKYFRGYARSGNRNYALTAKRGLLKKMAKCKDVKFSCKSYQDWQPFNQLVYCDPPYENTTMYPGTGEWDSQKFWDVMREWSHPKNNNIIIISEFTAPRDFECILSIPNRPNLRTKSGNSRTEKVFKMK